LLGSRTLTVSRPFWPVFNQRDQSIKILLFLVKRVFFKAVSFCGSPDFDEETAFFRHLARKSCQYTFFVDKGRAATVCFHKANFFRSTLFFWKGKREKALLFLGKLVRPKRLLHFFGSVIVEELLFKFKTFTN
jgi:hypothetical protein